MHLLYCDESNLEKRSGDFLIYGGIAIDGEKLSDLSQDVDVIREKFKLDREFQLKFNPAPKNMDHQKFIELKKGLLSILEIYEVSLLSYVVLHDIANNPDAARRNGINTVCYHFDCLLNRLDDHGIVMIDRFNDQGNLINSHLTEKFAIGLKNMPFSKEMRLKNIVGFHYSVIGQSHLCSLVDIVVGTLRFALNAHTRNLQEHLPSARLMLKQLSPLFHRDKGKKAVSELGFTFSPKVVQVDRYKSQYESLKEFLKSADVPTAQNL